MMRRVLYVSQQTKLMTDQDLINLLAEARSLNVRHEITGVLIHVGSFFIQCIEGQHDDIAKLCENISTDVRNRNFTILDDVKTSTRAFPDWSMGFRVMSMDELRQEEGFLDISELNGLELIKSRDKQAYDIMHAYYTSL
ncbi:MAG: BLUF domain-containing protein [Alphaproteobacteria bacterium]